MRKQAMTVTRHLAALAAVISAASIGASAPASAGDPVADFFGKDDRRVADTAAQPFSAVGRLNFAAGGHCTATLVAPRLILTAAHCIYGGMDPAAPVSGQARFYAGYNRGRYVAAADVTEWFVPRQYDAERHTEDRAVDGFDWAFMVLDRSIGKRAGVAEIFHGLTSAALEQAAAGDGTVLNAGYSGDSAELQTSHVGCPVTRIWSDNTFYHQCDSLPGSSGGPLFLLKDGTYRIIGIDSTISYVDGVAQYSMAVDARAFGRAFEDIRQRVEGK